MRYSEKLFKAFVDRDPDLLELLWSEAQLDTDLVERIGFELVDLAFDTEQDSGCKAAYFAGLLLGALGFHRRCQVRERVIDKAQRYLAADRMNTLKTIESTDNPSNDQDSWRLIHFKHLVETVLLVYPRPITESLLTRIEEVFDGTRFGIELSRTLANDEDKLR